MSCSDALVKRRLLSVATEKPREIALRVLHRAFQSDEILDRIMGDALADPNLKPRDRGLTQELVFGVIRSRRLIDSLLGGMVKKRPSAQIQTALQLGLYQLLFLTRIPDYAVLDEMVGIVKRMSGQPQARFVNAILRRIVRERDAILSQVAAMKETQPDIAYSCPGWLFRRWQARLGPEEIKALLEWQNRTPEVFVRVNRLKMSGEAFAAQAEGEGLQVSPKSLAWESTASVFQIENPAGMTQKDLFLSGALYVQDPSTLLSVDWLDPQAGERILDLCAAPGGKTTYIAEKMGDKGEIVACDTVTARLALVEENCLRLGIQSVTCRLVGARPLPENFDNAFDRVLADVPCSNTGVLRRRVDLRWRLKSSEIRQLTQRQLALLRRAASAVKSGGTLVYSTCSLEPEENSAIVSEFLDEDARFHLVSERQLTPYQDSCDGAYVALLKRKD